MGTEALGTEKENYGKLGTGKENFIGVGVGVGIGIDQTNGKSTPIQKKWGQGKRRVVLSRLQQTCGQCWGQGKRILSASGSVSEREGSKEGS
jgi:hypothetical protein